MQFPPTPRVVYGQHPLQEVVCQISFPRQLSIDESLPAEFQKALGSDYPYVETREHVPLIIGGTEIAARPRSHYDFTTSNKHYKITLTSEFVAVTTQNYTEWKEFEQHVAKALSALFSAYSIQLFVRIGLRYVNVISRKKLALDGKKWSDLVRHSALGLLPEDEVPFDDVLELNSATVLRLDVGKVTCRAGFGKVDKPADDRVLFIDNDFFEDTEVKGSPDAVSRILNKFNEYAGHAFRWFIEPELDKAFRAAGP